MKKEGGDRTGLVYGIGHAVVNVKILRLQRQKIMRYVSVYDLTLIFCNRFKLVGFFLIIQDEIVKHLMLKRILFRCFRVFGTVRGIVLGCRIFTATRNQENSKAQDQNKQKQKFTVFHIIVTNKVKATFDRGELDKIKGPYVLLSNHGSFFDVYFLSRLAHKHKFSFILNKYYFKEKPAKYILAKMGAIPKKLFSPDSETIKRTLRSIKLGYPVLMCPEGRLSIDGTNYQIRNETGK